MSSIRKRWILEKRRENGKDPFAVASARCPEILDTGQGNQFTAHESTQVLADSTILVPMDKLARFLGQFMTLY